MSWSASYASKDDFSSDARSSHSSSDIPQDQLDTARAAAKSIMESGAIGVEKDFSIYLGGHCNPDHVGNDFITVTINQKY